MLRLEVDAFILFSFGKGRFNGSGGVVSRFCISCRGFIILLLGAATTASAFYSSTAGRRFADLAGGGGAAGGGAALLWSDI